MKRKDPGLNASENMLLLFSCHIYIYIYILQNADVDCHFIMYVYG